MKTSQETQIPGPALPLEAQIVPPVVQGNIFMLALREQVVFPHMRTSISVKHQDFELLHKHCEYHHTDIQFGAVTLKPTAAFDVYEIGTFCVVIRHFQPSNSRSDNDDKAMTTIIVEGKARFQMVNLNQLDPYREATIKLIDQEEEDSDDVEIDRLAILVRWALVKLLTETAFIEGEHQNHNAACLNALEALLAGKHCAPITAVKNGSKQSKTKSASFLGDMIGAGLEQFITAERQQVLATVPVRERLVLVLDLVCQVTEAQRIQSADRKRCHLAGLKRQHQMRLKKQHRESVLQQQLNEIREELLKLKKLQLREIRMELSKLKNKKWLKSSL
jgi:ATP-dependent Lon protease